MHCPDGEPRPATEADDVRWVTLDEARELLTYDRDRKLVDALAEAVA
jgi:hypothetical protein